MLFVGLAIAWVLGCVVAAWRHPRSIAQVGGASWAEQLGQALEGARSDAERVTLANDALAEADHALRRREGVPTAAAWLALAGSALAALAGLLLQPAAELLGVVVVALAGAGACVLAARVGQGRAQRCRARLDAAVRERVGELYEAEVELPRRREMRWRRRRG